MTVTRSERERQRGAGVKERHAEPSHEREWGGRVRPDSKATVK